MKLPRLFAFATMVLAVLVTAGCRKATPTPTEPTSEPVTVIGPELTVQAPVVEFRERETDKPRPLEVGSTLTVQPGGNILVGENGRATLSWPGFVTNEILSGADTLLSLSDPDIRHAILDQASGTARYRLEGAGEPADLQVIADFVTVNVGQGEADFIVTFVPGAETSVWVALLTGEAEVHRGEDMVVIRAGQAAALSESGPLPEVLEVDSTAVRAWYEEVAAGTAEGSIATVAFRCVVAVTEAAFLSEPEEEAEPAGEDLPEGTLVDVLQRDEAGEWLRVMPLAALSSGWVAAVDLVCNGPIDNAPTEGRPGAEVPTATATRRPRVTFTPSATRPVVTRTPTVTPSPTGEAVIEFWVDDDEIELGDCTKLHWKVYNIDRVYLNGQGVLGGERDKKVCPDEDTTYTLKVIKRDGSEETRSVTVKVKGKKAQPTNTPAPRRPTATPTVAFIPTTPPPPTATNTPPPPPTATDTPPPPMATDTPVPPTNTSEPPTAEPPTAEPTTAEPPTTEAAGP